MFQGKYVFSQLVSLIPKYEFNKCVKRYKGHYKVKSFLCWNQFLCMCFGQLTYRESLRDVVICLNAHCEKLHHLGIQSTVVRSTLAKANEKRDWHIYADLAHFLIREARKLYFDEDEFCLELDNTVYALDSTTIDLCLSVFKWAKFRKKKGAIKLHTLLDIKGSIPTFIFITDGKVHDVNVLDEIDFEAGAIYLMDRAYIDFGRLNIMHEARSYFVVMAKKNFQFRRLYSRKVEKKIGLKCDQVIKLTGKKSAEAFPEKLRRVKYFDKEYGVYYVFLTNNFEIEAKMVADLYKLRWQVELFFKWIKQHLKIKVFWGESPNAVKTQVWIAIATYVLVAIAKKKFGLDQSLYEILQILSVSALDKTPVNELFSKEESKIQREMDPNQLRMFDL